MPLVITNTGTTATVTFADPAAAFHRTAGQYFIDYQEDEEQYALELTEGPATDGQPAKWHGFRRKTLGPFMVAFVDPTRTIVETTYTSEKAKMLATSKLSVAMPSGETFPSCRLTKFRKLRQPKFTSGGTYMMRCLLEFEQVRLT